MCLGFMLPATSMLCVMYLLVIRTSRPVFCFNLFIVSVSVTVGGCKELLQHCSFRRFFYCGMGKFLRSMHQVYKVE